MMTVFMVADPPRTISSTRRMMDRLHQNSSPPPRKPNTPARSAVQVAALVANAGGAVEIEVSSCGEDSQGRASPRQSPQAY